MYTIGRVVLGVLICLLLVGLRVPVEAVLRAVLGVPARALAVCGDAVAAARRHAVDAGARVRRDLAYGPAGAREPSGWDVLGPVVYAALLVVIVAGDLVLASLRFGALLGIPLGVLPFSGDQLDVLAGLLFVSVLATYGCVLLDLAHVTPLRRPYGIVTGRARSVLVAVAGIGTGMSVVAGVLFFVWGQRAIAGDPDADVADLFVAVFALILVGAGILAFGGSIAVVPAVWSVLCRAGGALLAVAERLLVLLLVVVDAIHRVLVAAVRLAAGPGTLVWNWFTRFPAARSLGLDPVTGTVPVEPLIGPDPAWPAPAPAVTLRAARSGPAAPALPGVRRRRAPASRTRRPTRV